MDTPLSPLEDTLKIAFQQNINPPKNGKMTASEWLKQSSSWNHYSSILSQMERMSKILHYSMASYIWQAKLAIVKVGLCCKMSPPKLISLLAICRPSYKTTVHGAIYLYNSLLRMKSFILKVLVTAAWLVSSLTVTSIAFFPKSLSLTFSLDQQFLLVAAYSCILLHCTQQTSGFMSCRWK